MIRTDFDLKIITATRPPYPKARNGLITVQVSIARDIWTEALTHRLAARNASSRRAMSGSRIVNNHGAWMPSVFYGRVRGMGDDDTPLDHWKQERARAIWEETINYVELRILELEGLGVSKQYANRLLTGAHITNGVITMTEGGWAYFLSLRNHADADRAMRELFAEPLADAISALDFRERVGDSLAGAEWEQSEYHLPFWPGELEGLSFDEKRLIACARIARVSYGEVRAAKDDLDLADRLVARRHASPFEHLAQFKKRARLSALNCLPADRYKGMAWETYRAELGF